jgi:hypothetical protein
MSNYLIKLSQYVAGGYSQAYIESCLYASFSGQRSIQQISSDVSAAISQSRTSTPKH